MTTAKAERYLLERLGAGGTVLLALLLDLPSPPDWSDGVDAEGRTVLLVGRHALGASEAGQAAAAAVLEALRAGEVPDGVQAIAYAPKASAFIAEILGGQGAEILGDGPRGSGKTQAVPAALAGLAELHARAGYPLPLRALWLHDSLTNASVKTGRSLEAPLWGGLWTVRDDRRVGALIVGGVEMVAADFVGTRDDSAGERSRAECHVAAAEELVPSLSESGGIEERSYELALTSMRLPTRRHVALATTNPGDTDTWPYRRWIEAGGRPGCVRVPIPASDRLTAEDVQALRAAFRESPDLERRLALGEWAALQLGPAVAVGFREDAHVAKARVRPVENVALMLGHDGGHTPCTIIGGRYQGELQIYVALASERAGTRQHVEALVRPWLSQWAPWALESPSTLLGHRYDPSMETGENADIDSDPIRVLRELLRGPMRAGAVSWPGRIDPVLALFNRLNPHTGRAVLQIDPVDGLPLVRALRGRWHYPVVGGVVSRDLPVKDHPWSDLGDSFCYLVGGLAPIRRLDEEQRAAAGRRPIPQQYAHHGGGAYGRPRRARGRNGNWTGGAEAPRKGATHECQQHPSEPEIQDHGPGRHERHAHAGRRGAWGGGAADAADHRPRRRHDVLGRGEWTIPVHHRH